MRKETVIAWLVVALLLVALVAAGPALLRWGNEYKYTLHKIDDATNYSTRKQVEDSCRAMMASYTADKLTYKQYKDSDSEEKRGWAEQAKMRANKTAASYNEYVLKNSYVWDGNIPKDIDSMLPYLE